MQFETPFQPATLIKRYKRFLADVTLPNGEKTTLHCPNTGSMLGCKTPGARVWYSDSQNPNRKLPYTWELVEVAGGALVGVNTHRPNALVGEAIHHGVVKELQGYGNLQREVPYGAERSRIDLLLSEPGSKATTAEALCYVEVKNVTLGQPDGVGVFPDAVTSRGTKHLRELMLMRAQGHRAVVFFCVQHTGITRVSPAKDIDPLYADTLAEAVEAGVEVLAYKAKLSPEEAVLVEALPVSL